MMNAWVRNRFGHIWLILKTNDERKELSQIFSKDVFKPLHILCNTNVVINNSCRCTQRKSKD